MDQTTSMTTRLGPLRVRTVGSGPPAVLWHSLFVDSTTWNRLVPTLAASRRLILIDGPGHGGNPPIDRPFTLDGCAGAAIDVLDHLDVSGPVDWIGNAWGGHVGIVFAASYPQRCRTLVAIGTPVHALAPEERRRIVLLRSLYRIVGAAPFTKVIADALLGPGANPDAARLVADAFRRAGRRGMSVAITSISLNRPDLAATLPAVTAATLLVTGADDRMCTPASSEAAVATLRHGRVVIVPGAGHVAPLLEPGSATADAVTAFWRDSSAATTAP